MAIVDYDTPPPKVNVSAEPVEIKSPDFKTSLVDSKHIAPENLLVNIEGSPWTVRYYSQVLGADEEISAVQPGQLPIYQQYLKIENMEVRVISPLSTSEDIENNELGVTGSAVTYPFIIPNIGDAFMADIGDGRTGLFTITSAERKSLLKQTTYEIEYTLLQFVDEQLTNTLEERVIKTVFFKKDLLANGQYPFLVESQSNAKDRIEKYISLFLQRYMMEFFSREYSTILVPGQDTPTYDHYIVQTMLRLFDPHDVFLLRDVRALNIDGERIMSTLNIWNNILGMQSGYGNIITQKMWVVPSTTFNAYPRLEGVRFSGIGYVVYPFMPLKPVDDGYRPYDEKTGIEFDNLGDMDWNLISTISNIAPGGLTFPGDPPLPEGEEPDNATVQIIHPVLIDDYYVFSEAFYTNAATGQSLLELMTHALINNESINFDNIFVICEDINNWGKIERFYYLPVLMAILKVLLRRI